jgi:hypothetical protein
MAARREAGNPRTHGAAIQPASGAKPSVRSWGPGDSTYGVGGSPGKIWPWIFNVGGEPVISSK